MPKRGIRVDHTQPSKTNWQQGRKVLTGAGRTHKHAVKRKAAVNLIQKRLGEPDLSEPELLRVAADALGWETVKSLDALFSFAAGAYLDRLEYSWGAVTPLDAFWEDFLGRIKPLDGSVAARFASDFEAAFRWFLVGYVQRFALECPNALKCVEVRLTEAGERRLVGVRNDGERFVITPDYYHPDPMVVYGGDSVRLALGPADLERLARLASHNPEQLRAQNRKFKLSSPPKELVTKATVLNAIVPRECPGLDHELGSLLWRPKRARETAASR